MKCFSFKCRTLIIGLVFFVGLTLVVATKVWPLKKEQDNNIVALVKAIGANRITEARLSGGFAYAPYTPLPKAEKKTTSEFELAENPGRLLISEGDFSNKSEATQNITLGGSKKSSSRGVESVGYQNNLFLSLDLQFPNLFEESFFRGNNDQTRKLGFSRTELKVANISDFKRIAATLMFTDAEQLTVEMTHALGIVYLFLGDFDESIKYLELTSANSPNDARILNDLAVVYLERFYLESDPQDLVYALAKAHDAFGLTKTLPEVRFNYALLLEKLFLKDLAKKTWQEYLQIETNNGWRNLALESLKELNALTVASKWQQEKLNLARAVEAEGESSLTAYKIIEQYPNPSRLYVIEGLLAEWGKSYLKNDPVAADKLRIARVIGNTLAKLQNDYMVRDMVVVVDKLLEADQKEQLKQLAHAHQVCKEGINLIDQSLAVKAYEKLKEALPIFSKLNDKSSETLVMLHLARCERALSKYEVSLKTISLVIERAEKSKYPYLLGRGWSVDANTYLYQVNLAKSLNACRKAKFYFEFIENWDDLTIVYLMFQSNSLRLRNLKDGVKYSYLALENSQLSVKEQALYLLSFFSENIIQMKQEKVAILFYDELIKILLNQKINTDIATGFQWRSLANYKLGNKEASVEDLTQAKKYSELIEDVVYRSRMEQGINLELAEIILSADPRKTIKLLDTIILFFDKTTDRFHKTQTYLIQARAYLQLKDFTNAEKSLQKTINEYEKERSSIIEESNRISFFENMITAYDEMIKLQINFYKNSDKAFDYAEKARARALLDTIETTKQKNFVKSKQEILLQNSSYPLVLKDIQQLLPSYITILKYKIFPEKLLIWAIQKDKINFLEISVKEEKLAVLSKMFLENIQKSYSKENLIENSELYNLLISPVAQFLADSKTIVIIPDDFLSSLPFSALINPNSKKYLIEDFAIGYSPSATIFIHCLEKESQVKNKEKQVLAIGNPKFTQANFPKLHYLKGAEKEAQTIAKLYPKARLLIKEQATKAAFIENLEKHNIIHFAGHGLLDRESSLSSLLVLSSDNKSFDEEALYAYELYNYSFTNTQLVVLSACQTASGQNMKAEGVISITRPFLARGVPCVIANLWDADDEVSRDLLIKFHQNVLNGQNSLKALQEAQKALIHSPNIKDQLPKIWATLVLLGSGVK